MDRRKTSPRAAHMLVASVQQSLFLLGLNEAEIRRDRKELLMAMRAG